MNQKGFATIGILVMLVILGLAGGGYYYFKLQQPIQQQQTQSNVSLLSEEESLDIAEQTVIKDLKNSLKISCLIFSDKKEANFITYTVTRKFNNDCPGDPTSAPTIPQIKIDRLSRAVFVRSLDGEFRPLVSSSIQNEMASWKTYRNEKFSFEFQYPPNWFILNTGGAIDLSDYDINDSRYERGNPSGTKVQFVPSTTTRKQFPQVITNENIGGIQDEFTKTGDDGLSTVYKINNPNDGNCYYLVFSKKSDQYVCVFAWFKRASIDKVISTFKFTR